MATINRTSCLVLELQRSHITLNSTIVNVIVICHAQIQSILKRHHHLPVSRSLVRKKSFGNTLTYNAINGMLCFVVVVAAVVATDINLHTFAKFPRNP